MVERQIEMVFEEEVLDSGFVEERMDFEDAAAEQFFSPDLTKRSNKGRKSIDQLPETTPERLHHLASKSNTNTVQEVSTTLLKCNVFNKIDEFEEEEKGNYCGKDFEDMGGYIYNELFEVDGRKRKNKDATTPQTNEDNSSTSQDKRVTQAQHDVKFNELRKDMKELTRDVNELKTEMKIIKEDQRVMFNHIIKLLSEIKQQKNVDSDSVEKELELKSHDDGLEMNKDVADRLNDDGLEMYKDVDDGLNDDGLEMNKNVVDGLEKNKDKEDIVDADVEKENNEIVDVDFDVEKENKDISDVDVEKENKDVDVFVDDGLEKKKDIADVFVDDGLEKKEDIVDENKDDGVDVLNDLEKKENKDDDVDVLNELKKKEVELKMDDNEDLATKKKEFATKKELGT
ncbi:coiled-coil domain-containing protein 1-like [Impatiens glandulifera]|uniref:coiled-coil domain-containing protein 1-like n=1 Tax=Impatiens glandulifera TaxID=253017 RepID=UPI001FB1177A|nr:coiled-coil domain-containing protein 1-like [Impatiens glandulifera]